MKRLKPAGSSQFAGISAAALFFAVFFVPELKGRSLEETDELFEMRLWAWQFNKAKTAGVGARIAQLEQGNADVENWEKLSKSIVDRNVS